jgi:hypothetical protein
MFIIDEAYIEATFEGMQFLAAFFFFYGLKILKRKMEVST